VPSVRTVAVLLAKLLPQRMIGCQDACVNNKQRQLDRRVQDKIVRTPSILGCVENGLTYVPHKLKVLRPVPWYKRFVPGDTGNFLRRIHP